MTEPTRTTPSRSTAWAIDDVAAYLGCEARTVRRLLATDPTFPPPRKVGRRLLWAAAVVPLVPEERQPSLELLPFFDQRVREPVGTKQPSTSRRPRRIAAAAR